MVLLRIKGFAAERVVLSEHLPTRFINGFLTVEKGLTQKQSYWVFRFSSVQFFHIYQEYNIETD
uniref:Uncharacterized protein n=1 Tax=Picea sitchensis TaxID=3332 RepID=A9NW34_PICSI|nr:unknown [Picea sitchensis]